jgi:hypothetical protein
MELDFFDRFSKNTQISNFIIIHPVDAEFFHAEGRTDANDEANCVAFCYKMNPSKRTINLLAYVLRGWDRLTVGSNHSVQKTLVAGCKLGNKPMRPTVREGS